MKHLDLFSGIGGFALAARWVGWETVGFCEIDPYCQKVLRKHWPDVPIYEDVRELDGRTVGHVDIITGGYPCQPFSVAGKQRGEADDRHLWPEFARLIREIKPDIVVGENVANHINMGLDNVLADLEGLGYAWEAFVIPACSVDAPHRRERVWVVANAIGKRRWADARAQSQAETEREGLQQKDRQALPGHFKEVCEFMADADSQGPQGHGGLCERADELSSWPGSWTLEEAWLAQSGMGRVADGIPKRVDRLKGLGNAIVPQVAEMIFRAIEDSVCQEENTDG